MGRLYHVFLIHISPTVQLCMSDLARHGVYYRPSTTITITWLFGLLLLLWVCFKSITITAETITITNITPAPQTKIIVYVCVYVLKIMQDRFTTYVFLGWGQWPFVTYVVKFLFMLCLICELPTVDVDNVSFDITVFRILWPFHILCACEGI